MSSKYKFSGIALCLFIIAISGFRMYQLMESQRLWGYWTLPFIAAIWALIVLIFEKRYNKRWLLLSTLSGVLLTLGFPNSPMTPLMFVGFVPLLMVEKEVLDSGNKHHGILKYAYNAFVIWNVGATWWVGNAGLLPGMIANFLNAFFMCLPFWFFHKINGLINPNWAVQEGILKTVKADNILKYLAFIALWVGFEYGHLNWEISWTWLTLGNAFAEYPSWIQWYEYTGVFGGTLWILLLNVLIFKIVEATFYKKENAQRLVIQLVAGFFLPILISVLIKLSVANAENSRINVVVVQPNYEPNYEKFDVPDNIQLQKYLRLAAQKVDSTTDYLVFPETSFDLRNCDQFSTNVVANELKNFVNRFPKLHLVLGIDAFKIYAQYAAQKPANLPPSVREYDNRDGTFTYWEFYNAATQITSGVDSMPLYKKSKLVPGPENLPYGNWLGFLKPLFKKFGGTVGGLGGQSTRAAFWNKDGEHAVAPVICYESIYGDFCTGYVREGAQAIFVVTNDGWWDNTPGYVQHLQFAQLRAIELRRAVVRSANTGASCFINKNGEIEQQTAYGKDAVIKGTIEMNKNLTVYARLGDVLGRSGAWISVGFLLGFGILFLQKKFETK